MKNFFLAVILSLTVILSLSCGTNQNVSADSEIDTSADMSDTLDTQETPETKEIEIDYKEDLRQSVIDYMVKMSLIEWKPAKEIDLTGIDSTLKYSERNTYVGMPYVNVIDSNYEEFETHLENGVYTGSVERETCIGVDCTSSIIAAYEKITGTDISAYYTGNMLPHLKKGIVAVGLYEYSLSSGDVQDTPAILAKNDPEVIYEAYALLQKADTLLRRMDGNGHTRMVYGEVNVARNQAGKIIPDRSYITYIDQNLKMKNTGSGKYTTWSTDVKWTFKQMYEENYIPVTCEELHIDYFKIKDILSAYGANTSDDFPGKFKGQIVSTYPMNTIKLSILDEGGETVYTQNGMMQSTRNFFDISVFDYSKMSSSLQKGKTYTLIINVKNTNRGEDVVRFDFTAD